MPQGPIAVLQTPATGGTLSALNVTAAEVIKAAPGRLARVLVNNGGTAANGAFTFNDTTSVGGANAGNTIFSIPSGTTAGTVYTFEWPCLAGIVLSAVPTAGSPNLSISYS